MLTNDRIIAFGATVDPERARAFYQDVLGLRLVADEPHAIVFDCAGTMLRIQKAPSLTPHPFTLLGWQVEDIKAKVRALSEKGVSFVRYPGFDQDEDGSGGGVTPPDLCLGMLALSLAVTALVGLLAAGWVVSPRFVVARAFALHVPDPPPRPASLL